MIKVTFRNSTRSMFLYSQKGCFGNVYIGFACKQYHTATNNETRRYQKLRNIFLVNCSGFGEIILCYHMKDNDL